MKVLPLDDRGYDAAIVEPCHHGCENGGFTASIRDGAPGGHGRTEKDALEGMAKNLRDMADRVEEAARRL